MTYPTGRLEGETALVLFAAAFAGRNDAVFIRDAGLTADCVDTDCQKLDRMAINYPADWRYTCMDAFEFGEAAQAAGNRWDVVSLDPFTNMFRQVANRLSLWCSLAKRLVVMGSPGAEDLLVPVGWRIVDVIRRSPIAYWTVLEADVRAR